jgi:glycosyltransferase involved in cell wall biosynthesis
MIFSPKPRICAIIPAFNEETNISETLNDLLKERPEIVPIIIDDCSTDNTAGIAIRPGIVLLRLPVNLGIGGAVQTGLKYAGVHKFDVAIQFDGDGQHMASEIGKILNPIICGEADVAIGSRFLGEDRYAISRSRKLGTGLLGAMISLITGKKFTDTTSGFRAYGPRAIDYLADNYPQDFPEPEAIVDLLKAGFRLVEIPVKMKARGGGQSSIGRGDSLYYMIKVILATLVAATRRPV